MDIFLQFLLTIFSSILALLICIYFLCRSTKPKSCSVPEVAGAWPIIGHMHLFDGKKLTYQTLSTMAYIYGPIFTIRLGSHKTLVVNNQEWAKECFTVHDKVFSTRSVTLATKILCFDNAMFGFAPHSPYWREMRKITTVELLSSQRLDMFKHIRASEVLTSIKELYSRVSSSGGAVVDMKHWFQDVTFSVNLRIVAGRRRFFGDEEGKTRHVQNMIRNFFYLFGVFVVSDSLPFLGWLDFGGYEKVMKRTAKELDGLVTGWLDEHRQRRLLRGEEKEDQDFMDVMLTILENVKIPTGGFNTDTITKATCLNLIVAAETTMVPLAWALSLLLNNPHELKKAQEELNIHVGKDRHVEESDIKNLVYLQAIVKESMRLYPPGPIIPRTAMEDCTLSNGYHVESGTRLIVNVWKIQHDERVWSNPNEFQPERFLTDDHKEVDMRGLSFELMPFGSGRRSCSGTHLALQVVHLVLASLLQSFEMVTPLNEAVDMSESPGMTNIKATPLEVLLTPRLDPKLYTVVDRVSKVL